MEYFNTLLQIIDRLMAPEGCPWDRQQTVQSMRPSLLEEAYEVVEAIDLDDNQKIEEELGDLLFNVAFISRLAEKESRFTLVDVLHRINAKLIRRHPHIFANAVADTSEEVLKQWEEIKRVEKGDNHKNSVLDTIPKDLPSLARAQKILSKCEKVGYQFEMKKREMDEEETLGNALLNLIVESKGKGIDADHALQKVLTQLSANFRLWEKGKC